MEYLNVQAGRARLADIITRNPGDGHIRQALGRQIHKPLHDDEPLRVPADATDEELLARFCPEHPVAAVFAHQGGGGNL